MADLIHQLKFPDIVLWSVPARTVIMIELTVPWEEEVEAAHKRKKERYTKLSAACSEAGWKVFTFPVKVRCRGASTQQLLKTLRVTGHKRKRAMQDLARGGARELLSLASEEMQDVG